MERRCSEERFKNGFIYLSAVRTERTLRVFKSVKGWKQAKAPGKLASLSEILFHIPLVCAWEWNAFWATSGPLLSQLCGDLALAQSKMRAGSAEGPDHPACVHALYSEDPRGPGKSSGIPQIFQAQNKYDVPGHAGPPWTPGLWASPKTN